MSMQGSATSAAASSAGAKLRMQHVGMVFERDGKTIPVLEDLNLDVQQGEFICVVGPSGCGEVDAAECDGGISFADEWVGFDRWGGRARTRSAADFGVSGTGVFPWLTVEGNIGFGLSKLPEAERKQRIAHYVQMVRLQGFEQTYPSDLSGGMKQRLQVARALAVNPDILYLDEPFGALDSVTRLIMRQELLRIWQAERRTIIFVTHDIDEAVQLADRVVVLSSRPAQIKDVLTVDIAHPRNLSSARYLELRDQLASKIGLAYVA